MPWHIKSIPAASEQARLYRRYVRDLKDKSPRRLQQLAGESQAQPRIRKMLQNMKHCYEIEPAAVPDAAPDFSLARRITVLFSGDFDRACRRIHPVRDKSVPARNMQKCPAPATDIEQKLFACAVFSGAIIKEADVVGNDTLPIGLFKPVEQPSGMALRLRIFRPPVFLRIKFRQSGIVGRRILKDTSANAASRWTRNGRLTS